VVVVGSVLVSTVLVATTATSVVGKCVTRTPLFCIWRAEKAAAAEGRVAQITAVVVHGKLTHLDAFARACVTRSRNGIAPGRGVPGGVADPRAGVVGTQFGRWMRTLAY